MPSVIRIRAVAVWRPSYFSNTQSLPTFPRAYISSASVPVNHRRMSRSCMERSSNMLRTGDEAFVWRVGVVGGQARRIERTEGTVVYQALCLSVTGIEASLEAHLHDRPGKLRPIRHGLGLLTVHRYRVLAKHWQTGVETGADQRGSEPGPDHPFDGLI